MTVQLGDDFTVNVNGNDHSGKVAELFLNGSVEDPDSVRVRLHSGAEFTIPWEQYQRGGE